METAGFTLSETFKIMDKAHQKINKVPGKIGKSVQSKLEYVLSKNQGEKKLRDISKLIDGEEGSLPEGWSASDIASLKYCPVQSVDVERSFSVYKTILTDRRTSFTEENLSKVMICHCFFNRQD